MRKKKKKEGRNNLPYRPRERSFEFSNNHPPARAHTYGLQSQTSSLQNRPLLFPKPSPSALVARHRLDKFPPPSELSNGGGILCMVFSRTLPPFEKCKKKRGESGRLDLCSWTCRAMYYITVFYSIQSTNPPTLHLHPIQSNPNPNAEKNIINKPTSLPPFLPSFLSSLTFKKEKKSSDRLRTRTPGLIPSLSFLLFATVHSLTGSGTP